MEIIMGYASRGFAFISTIMFTIFFNFLCFDLYTCDEKIFEQTFWKSNWLVMMSCKTPWNCQDEQVSFLSFTNSLQIDSVKSKRFQVFSKINPIILRCFTIDHWQVDKIPIAFVLFVRTNTEMPNTPWVLHERLVLLPTRCQMTW